MRPSRRAARRSAGRGFAVVASEVKALAEQTSKATGEIAQQISGIQSREHRIRSRRFKEISGTIEKLSEISSAIARRWNSRGAANAGNLPQRPAGGAGYDGGQAPTSPTSSMAPGETGAASSQVLSARAVALNGQQPSQA